MSQLPRRLQSLRSATLADGRVVDVELDGDLVVSVQPAGPSVLDGDHTGAHDDRPDVLDLRGFLLLPAPAEPHAHLDKALSWDLIAPPMGDLVLAIESWKRYAATMTTASIADRARRQALTMLQNGTTAIRCHVDLLSAIAPDGGAADPMRGVRALAQVRDELAQLVDLELVALAGPNATDEQVNEAIDLGVDLVGGAPHLAEDPDADLRRLLAIATARGVGVDMHTDESLGGPVTMGTLTEVVRDWPASRPVTAGHCVRLGTLEPVELDRLIEGILAADIGIVTLPITNLYLQGWEHPVATPRGLTAVRALLDAGVRLGAGADNVRDPFNPVGRSDALETASLLVTAGHLTLDEAYAAVSTGARSVMNLPAAGIEPGSRAELLAVRADNLSDAIANASADRYVVHRGRLVAESSVTRSIAPISGADASPLALPGPKLAEPALPQPQLPEPQYETR